MIEYDKFAKSLTHLYSQFNNYKTLDATQPKLIQEAVAESVIQRFETCYDCMWKVLKRYLFEELGLPDIPNSPKPIFRRANENRLLPSPIETWLSYADARISTAHDYSGEKAIECLKLTGDFIQDAATLYEVMNGKRLEWKYQ